MTATIGRIVYFYTRDANHPDQNGKPFPAIVTNVTPLKPGEAEDTLDLTVFPNGRAPFCVAAVANMEDAADDASCVWDWMPYQKAVIAGTVAPTLHDTAATPPQAPWEAPAAQAEEEPSEAQVTEEEPAPAPPVEDPAPEMAQQLEVEA